MKIVLNLKWMLVLSALWLAGCGGGGNDVPPATSGGSVSYSGQTSKAALTKKNAKYFVELVNSLHFVVNLKLKCSLCTSMFYQF